MSENIQYVEMESSNLILDVEHKIDLSLIKEGCRICNITYYGGGVVIVNKEQVETTELDLLKGIIERQLPHRAYVIMYSRLSKYHTQFSYYDVIAIASSNLNDLKKVMKIHKMKAFL